MPGKYEVGTAANHYISQLYHEALKNKLDVTSMLNTLGLTEEVFDKPELRVKTEKLAKRTSSISERLSSYWRLKKTFSLSKTRAQ